MIPYQGPQRDPFTEALRSGRSPLTDAAEPQVTAAFDATITAVTAEQGPNPSLCPLRVQSSLEAYVRGLPPSGFLRAVLSNDLNEAITRADDVNIHALPHIVAYCREHLPALSWGSESHVNRWLENKRKERDERPFAKGPDRDETERES